MMRQILNMQNKDIFRALFMTKSKTVSQFNQSVMIKYALDKITLKDYDGYEILNMVCGPSLPDYQMEIKRVNNKDGS